MRFGPIVVAASAASIGAMAASCTSFGASPDADPRRDAAAADAGSVEGGAAGCAGYASAIFCEDFDGRALGENWTAFSAGTGSATLETNGRSRPRAARMTLPGGQAYDGPQLRKRLDGPFTKLRCTAHVARVDVGQNLLDMMDLEVTTSAPKLILRAYMGTTTGGGVLHVSPPDGGPRISTSMAGPPGINRGEFHSITLEMELPTARIYVDGSLISTADSGVSSPTTGATLMVGPQGCEGVSTDWTLLYDDVFCERE